MRDLLRPTEHAASTSTLLELVKIRSPEKQRDVASVLVSGKVDSVYAAQRAVEQRYHACQTCGEVQDSYLFLYRDPIHCDQCNAHFAPNVVEPWREVCGACGWKSKPWASPPGRRPTQTPRAGTMPGASAIVGSLPGPFYKKGGHTDARIDLPIPGEERPVPASDLACQFADAVDALAALSAEHLAEEASSPVVRFAGRKLARWFDKLRPALETEGDKASGGRITEATA